MACAFSLHANFRIRVAQAHQDRECRPGGSCKSFEVGLQAASVRGKKLFNEYSESASRPHAAGVGHTTSAATAAPIEFRDIVEASAAQWQRNASPHGNALARSGQFAPPVLPSPAGKIFSDGAAFPRARSSSCAQRVYENRCPREPPSRMQLAQPSRHHLSIAQFRQAAFALFCKPCAISATLAGDPSSEKPSARERQRRKATRRS